ncbi:hypothetical protein ACHHYP_09641 [Achlya hypogyna]|uniref:Uncharacterized protein n=1 Tax=Achlya hypogyna TaxID=1202772 RepID=A0A1V9YMV2_ACHHY|nr:hypothetical protein ACHHYP_09641 [Achlya hypogyna]
MSMYVSATNSSRFIHLECSEPLFQTSYKRNNKSSGHKNLRCFPHCCKTHNAHGYCGSTLLVETTLSEQDLVVYAKFDLESSQTLLVGDVVPQAKFEAPPSPPLIGDTWISAKRIENPVFDGYIAGRQIFEINSKRNSWHYGWVSSRFVKSNVQHQMKVFLLAPRGPGSLVVVDILCSLSFRIESTRTGAKQLKALNPTAKKVEKPKPRPPTTTPEHRAPPPVDFKPVYDESLYMTPTPPPMLQRRGFVEPPPRYTVDPWRPAMELPYNFRPAPFQMLATDTLFSDKDFLDTIISDMQQDDTTPRVHTVVPLGRRY